MMTDDENERLQLSILMHNFFASPKAPNLMIYKGRDGLFSIHFDAKDDGIEIKGSLIKDDQTIGEYELGPRDVIVGRVSYSIQMDETDGYEEIETMYIMSAEFEDGAQEPSIEDQINQMDPVELQLMFFRMVAVGLTAQKRQAESDGQGFDWQPPTLEDNL